MTGMKHKIRQAVGKKVAPKTAKAGAHALASAMVKKVSSTKAGKEKYNRKVKKF